MIRSPIKCAHFRWKHLQSVSRLCLGSLKESWCGYSPYFISPGTLSHAIATIAGSLQRSPRQLSCMTRSGAAGGNPEPGGHPRNNGAVERSLRGGVRVPIPWKEQLIPVRKLGPPWYQLGTGSSTPHWEVSVAKLSGSPGDNESSLPTCSFLIF